MRVVVVLLALLVLGCGQSGAPARERVVEVGAVRTTLAGQDLSVPLTDETVAELEAHRDVGKVVPRTLLAVPARGTATVGGKEVTFELGGLVDGIDPRHITEDPALAARFAATDGPVPVLISPSLIEVYNTRYASVHGLPVIGPLEEHLATRNPLRFTITLGETAIEAQVIGVSSHATEIGVTVPIEYVRRWNREHKGEQAAITYLSLDVTLKDERRLAAFEAWLSERSLRVIK